MNKQQKIILTIFVFLSIGFCFLFVYSSSDFWHGHNLYNYFRYGARLIKDNVEYGVYFDRASWLEEGLLPYKDVKIEYPQFAALYVAWPNLLANNFDQFQKTLLVSNLICYLALVYITLKLLKYFKRSIHYIWLLLLPSLIYFTLNRFDILPALLVQLVLYFTLKKRYQLAFLLLTISFFVKWYALILLPVLILYIYVKEKNYKKLIKKGLILFGVIFIAIFGLSVFLFGQDTFFPYAFHLNRGIEVGSLFFLIYLYTPLFDNFITNNLLLGLIFLGQFTPLFYLGVQYFFYGSQKIKDKLADPRLLVVWFSLLIAFFIAFSKIYSNQWLLWLTPVLLLQIDTKKELWLIIALDLINYIQFPLLYDSKLLWFWPMDLVVLIRSTILFWLIYILIKKIKNKKEHLPDSKIFNRKQKAFL